MRELGLARTCPQRNLSCSPHSHWRESRRGSGYGKDPFRGWGEADEGCRGQGVVGGMMGWGSVGVGRGQGDKELGLRNN
eukprot:764629-Hanusia_phi.AAC.1